MRCVIGIVGKIRSGKGTVEKIITQELQQRGLSVASRRFSDILRETEASWYLPPGRDTQQKLVLAMRQYFGENTLANVVEKRALNSSEDVVILDGLRWIDSDYPLLRKLPNNYLIYVEASIETRWQRSLLDNQKIDETRATFEQFKVRDNAPNEAGIIQFKQHADFLVDNSSDLENLKGQVVECLAGLKLLSTLS